ncbi:MAG: hypothetical protein MJK04_19960 [Psychrosphaera sp.]|nr:hypothetical protein [Psychrosphaera sp.]
MNIQNVKHLAHKLQNELPLLAGVNSPQEHESALAIMDELNENYDQNLLLIDLLWLKIEQYEDTAPELAAFNQRIGEMDAGASMLRLLMAQHQLKTADFRMKLGLKEWYR